MAPSYTVDLSRYRERLSATIPDGRYLAQVDDYEFSKSKAGNDMFTVWVRIVRGPYTGNVIIERLSLSDKALFKIVGFLNGLGIETPKKRLSINPEAWKNRKVWIDTVKGEPYRGRPGTSQIDGYARYVPETEQQDAVSDAQDYVEMDRSNEPVKAFETEPAEAVAASQGDEAPAEDGPVPLDNAPEAEGNPRKAEPEMLNLSDINL